VTETGLPRIVLVTDERATCDLQELGRRLTIVAGTLDHIAADTAADAQALLVDVDLHNLSKVQQLRRALAPLPRTTPIFFAVDRGTDAHFSVVQANALGGRRMLTRPYTAADVLAALADLAPRPVEIRTVPRRPAAASVTVAAALLKGSFRSLTLGVPLDLDATADAGQQMLLGVQESGLGNWLDDVRSHHDGTFQHCLLVAGAAAAWGIEAKLPPADQAALTTAALLHDLGKAKIPNEILDKPGKLDERETAIIRRHPIIAREYLVTQKGLSPAILHAVTHHHEMLDGSGYPSGLKGDQIPTLTRVLTVCDIYGALIERRPYKAPKPPADALLLITDMASKGLVDFEIVRVLANAFGLGLRSDALKIIRS
jgi:putative nucleotidyltransferase with HDIG domain